MRICTFGKTPLNFHYYLNINGIQWDYFNGNQCETLQTDFSDDRTNSLTNTNKQLFFLNVG